MNWCDSAKHALRRPGDNKCSQTFSGGEMLERKSEEEGRKERMSDNLNGSLFERTLRKGFSKVCVYKHFIWQCHPDSINRR